MSGLDRILRHYDDRLRGRRQDQLESALRKAAVSVGHGFSGETIGLEDANPCDGSNGIARQVVDWIVRDLTENGFTLVPTPQNAQ